MHFLNVVSVPLGIGGGRDSETAGASQYVQVTVGIYSAVYYTRVDRTIAIVKNMCWIVAKLQCG